MRDEREGEKAGRRKAFSSPNPVSYFFLRPRNLHSVGGTVRDQECPVNVAGAPSLEESVQGDLSVNSH